MVDDIPLSGPRPRPNTHFPGDFAMRTRSPLLTIALALGSLLVSGPATAQLGPGGAQFWSQDTPGIDVELQAGSEMGYALATGDFDCDGYEDLAIGMPGEDLPGAQDAGRVLVLRGGAGGITADGHQAWSQDSPGIENVAELDDYLGRTLAAGDFDGDGCDDLAIGVPSEGLGSFVNAGAVHVLFGGPGGLTGDDDQLLHQGMGDLATDPDTGDGFGSALAAGDLDADGIDDLAIGVAGEDIVGFAQAGMVHVLYGSASGLQTTGTTTLRRGFELDGPLQMNEFLGGALAVGNFSGFSGDELAIGGAWREVSGQNQAGAVILVSDVDDLVLDSQWHQDATGVPGVAEVGDFFGYTLAAGDFDGDGFDELAVGVIGEDREDPAILAMGAVNVLDFDGGSHQLWTQDDLPPEEEGEDEYFGYALAAGDFDGDGVDDLAASSPGENLGPIELAGIVLVIPGQAGTGLVAAGTQIWRQTVDLAEFGDQFGLALAVGRFAGHSADDLAVGVPQETVSGATGAGAVDVIYSVVLLRDGFESGDFAAWSSTVP